MPTRLVSVVFDASAIEAQGRFWADALGWSFEEKWLEHDEGVARDPATGLEIVTVPVDEPKRAKNRVHLDLGPSMADGQEAMVAELLGRGATRVDIGQGDVEWVVMADPEGNEFCVAAHQVAEGRLAAIAFDAADPAAQAAFWVEATGWQVEMAADWGVALRHPSGTGPALTLGAPATPKKGKNRVHLDVAPYEGDDQPAEVERLVALGARPIDIGQGSEVSWTVLADPEDNEFCVLSPR